MKKSEIRQSAKDYNDWYRKSNVIHWEEAASKLVVLNALKACCQQYKSARVLDIACGTGTFMEKLRNEVGNEWQLHGIDYSSVAIEMAEQRSKTKNLNLKLFCQDATSTKFEAGFFDAITCCGSWEHFEEPQKAFNEAARLLKNGGYFFGMIPVLGINRTDRDDEGWYEEKEIPGFELRQMQWNLKRPTWEKMFDNANLQLFTDSFAENCGALKPKVFFFGVKINKPKVEASL